MGGDSAWAAAGMNRRVHPTLWPGRPARQAKSRACTAYYRHAPVIAVECGTDDTQIPPDGARQFARQLADIYHDQPQKMRVTLHAGVAHRCPPEMWTNVQAWFQTHLITAEAES